MNLYRTFVSFFNRRVEIKLVAITSLIVYGLGVVLAPYLASGQNISSNLMTPLMATTVDGIQCNIREQFRIHIHTHIDIFVNGRHVYIPSQIGIIPGKCIYWIHTHDGSGIIHVESPIKRDFVLGQFFDLWKSKLSNPKIFDNIFNGAPSVYINGSKVLSTTSYRDIKIFPHQEIAIVYGKSPFNNIPSKYDFPPGL